MKIDLNFPPFQQDLFSLDKTQLTAFVKSVKKINKMDLRQVQQSSGLNLEKIKNLKTSNGKTLYSIRMSKSFRAVICIEDDFIRFISLHPDHDSAYK
jgi:mRNA-degrading endonuclease RelE of RelBE toxin-antitoxin system|tara:strand:+ start:728 stop:1018 length:291 start_codon:yes stop_codon:yes gene_type:complete